MVVDDSAYNRRSIAGIFANFSTEVEVVGHAADGEQALLLVTKLRPDVITLDLEMPRMDGFTFLRILMARQPTPVVVVSSYAHRGNVFKALDLGAYDFVAKPLPRLASSDSMGTEILEKVLLVRHVRAAAKPLGPARAHLTAGSHRGRDARENDAPKHDAPAYLVAFASSTGGPRALVEIFQTMSPYSDAAYLVAQHMPEKFTRTFAERLDRSGALRTAEARDGDRVGRRQAFVCPGRYCMEVAPRGGELRLQIMKPREDERYVPSGDRLMQSVASVAGPRSVGVVLTGMGDDGLAGARSIREAGGLVIAESDRTAAVNGMPGAVVRAGLAHRVLPLYEIGEALAQLT